MITQRKDNPQHRTWRIQVWANYHYGQMSMDEAERLAGPEPARWIEAEQGKVQ